MILALFLTIIFGVIVVKASPDKWWVELLALICLTGSIFLGVAWFLKKKWGVIASVGLVGILLMSRWDVLDWLYLGLWLTTLSVIALVN